MNTTGITVQELLQIPILREAKVISGHAGLNRVVRYIDIMEVPEIKDWLREGELLLTTAYSIRHDPSLLPELVRDLAQAGAAALAIKPERFIQDIPVEMISVSTQFSLPIIEIPRGIPYIDITQAVMEQVLDRQSALLRRSEEVYKTLTTMVLENSGIQAVADIVADLVKASVRVIDNYGAEIVVSPYDQPWRPKLKPLSWSITLDKQVVGQLLIDKKQLDAMERVCVEQARLVFSLELMRRKTEKDTEQRLRGNFVDELLSALPPAKHVVKQTGQQFGLNPKVAWTVALIEMAEGATEKCDRLVLQKLLDQQLTSQTVRTHLQIRQNRLVLLLPMQEIGSPEGVWETGNSSLKEWNRPLRTWIIDQGLTSNDLHIGIGGSYPLWEVHKSYAEARKAFAIGKKMYPEELITLFSDVEAYHLLSLFTDNPEFASLSSLKLGRLSAYDKENGTDMIRTLHAYLESGGSLVETANRLYIHRNSVKYRIERMKEIADINFSNARERFKYQLCLAYYFLQAEDELQD